MQGHEVMDRTLLDAASMVGHLVDPGSMFAFLAGHRGGLFPEEMFADLFPSVEGASSIPGSVMASVMTLQTLHDYSDRETAEAVRCDLRWKVACGLALDDAGFHPTTLVYWRRRLARSDRPHRINDAVKSVITQTGILRKRHRRAVDSTILADAVATQDTITQLIAAVRRVARVVPGAADLVAAVCTGHDYTTPGKPRIDWEDPEAKDGLVSALVNDDLALVNALADNQITPEASEAVALLGLVAGQDVEPAEGSDGTDGRWKIAHRVAEDRVISTVDPEARHTRKSPEARRDGYRAHLVAEPGTGLITDEELTQAAGPDNSDPAIAAAFLAADTDTADTDAADTDTIDTQATDGDAEPADTDGGGVPGPSRTTADAGIGEGQAGLAELVRSWFADSAYGTGDLRAAIKAAGHRAVIKPKPLQVAVKGGFSVDDFTVDAQAATVTCPNQITRPISPGRVATFGSLCRSCPLAARCTTSKTGRKIVLHEHDAELRAARRTWADDPDLRAEYAKHRPNVERAVSQVATRGGRRLKLRYRGTVKNNAWLKRRTAALNLGNLIRRGLDYVNGTWIVATT
jgi:IS5 family transposase